MFGIKNKNNKNEYLYFLIKFSKPREIIIKRGGIQYKIYRAVKTLAMAELEITGRNAQQQRIRRYLFLAKKVKNMGREI